MQFEWHIFNKDIMRNKWMQMQPTDTAICNLCSMIAVLIFNVENHKIMMLQEYTVSLSTHSMQVGPWSRDLNQWSI